MASEMTVRDAVLTFVSRKPLDIFDEMQGHFPALLLKATKSDIFYGTQ